LPIHHAVLGLLAESPSYGYELKTKFEEAIGPQWGELNIGHLYQVLDRLMRDGFVTRRAVTQPDRPDKLIYRLTKSGRHELETWLQQPFVRQSGYRDDFFLKLFAASRLGPERLRAVLRAQRQVYLAELAALGDLRKRRKGDPLVSLLIEAAVLHTGANLKVVERADEQAEQIASVPATESGRVEPVLATERGIKRAPGA
jgi:DNA-binding PadR family transcriptional regulator